MQHKMIISRSFIFVLSAFIILLFGFKAHSSIYKNCIFSYEFADIPKSSVVVRAIGDICYDRCENECGGFSRTYNGVELNQDIIDRCTIECRKGNPFSSTVREPFLNQDPGGNSIYKVSTENFSTATHCSKGSGSIDSADFIVYRSGIAVSKTDKFMIDLISPPGFEGNVVYLCGRQTTYLDLDRGSYPGASINDRSRWEARHYPFFYTDIAPRDGDFLSITYTGKYMFDCQNNCISCYGKPKCICPGNTCKERPEDFHLLIRDPSNNSTFQSANGDILPGGDLILTAPPPNPGGGPPTSYPQYNVNPVDAYNQNLTKEWKGLVPNVYSAFEPHYGENTKHISFSGYLGVPSVRESNSGLPSYNFDNISGGSSYSPRHSRLGIKHYDQGANTSWSNNQGGLYGKVSWKGCSQFKANRLQYTTIDPKIDTSQIKIADLEWIDLEPDDVLEPVEFTLNSNLSEGEIVLRVKPFNANDYAPVALDCNFTEPECASDIEAIRSKYNEYNAFGQYYISVTKMYDELEVLEKVSDAIRNVKAYFFGNDTKDGLMQFIYKALVSETAVMDIIRAVLIFYIAFTGFSFMIGISPITQREGAIRLIKIGVVLMLISENSWDFFYNSFFKIFLEGMTEVIANIASPIYLPDSKIRDEIIKDGANVFLIFDEPLRILFSVITWKKIYGLMLTSIMGLLFAIVLGLGCIITILVLIKALIIYITALIVLAILVILSPIFITLVLFGYTKQMFDNWLKQLIVYTLQPIFVFTAISLLLHLLVIGVKMGLSFTICETCTLGFTVPFGSDDNFTCLIPGYTTLFGAHMPSQSFFSMPLANTAILLYLLIVSQAMYAFCNFATSLAILIGSGQFVGFDLAEVARSFRSIGFITDSVATAVGIDARSRGISARRRR